MSKEVIFKIIDGNLKGEEFVFEEDGLCLIGRSADCALQIPKAKDMRISRRHCLLILNPPNVRIRDLGSRNGTTVNDEYLDSATLSDDPEKMTPVDRILKDSDVICIGETVFSVAIPSMKSTPSEAAPSKVIPAQTAPKSGGVPAPRTKVIQLSKPNPTQTGTVIPKSQPMATGFFQAPTSSPASTASRTIAMTEAISREELAKNQQAYLDKKAAEKNIAATQQPVASTAAPGSMPSGPLAPPPPPKKLVAKIVPKPQATTAAGPLAPPPPPEAPKKAPILLGKKKSGGTPAAANATEGKPRVLKAKIVSAPAPAKLTKKQEDVRARTEVMSIAELEGIDDVPEVSTAASSNAKQKRVTKFKIKGPK